MRHVNLRLITLLFFSVFYGFSQRDTIEVSKSVAVVIFPDNISDRIMGDDITFFTNDKVDEGSAFSKRILKLYYNESPQATNKYTDLTVITVDGNSYEFVLQHQKNPKQNTWYIKPEQAVTNILGKKISTSYHDPEKTIPRREDPVVENSVSESVINNVPEEGTGAIPQYVGPTTEDVKETARPTEELYQNDPREYYRLRSYYMQFDKSKIPRFYERVDDVFLWLKGIYFNKNELYIQFKIVNQAGVDLDINFLKFSVATSYKKVTSNQKTEIFPEYRFKVPQKVLGNSENHFVVVFKKFSLDRNRVLIVDLDEDNGNRNLSLEIDHHLINNPHKVK